MSQLVRLIAPRYRAYCVATIFALTCAVIMAGHIVTFGAELSVDTDAYWQAAMRLRSGDLLYPEWESIALGANYRYAPWWAALWVPLTFLSKSIVFTVWHGLVISAGLWLTWPLRRSLALLVIGPLFLQAGITGNVQPLMVAGIVLGVRSGYGPVGIALAASLKATPILFVLYYVGRRQWREVAITGVLTIALVAPFLVHELDHYILDPARTMSLSSVSPVLWAMVAVVAAVCAVWFAGGRYGWFVSSVAVLAALPRMLFYDLSYLLVPAWLDKPRAASGESSPGNQPIYPSDPQAEGPR